MKRLMTVAIVGLMAVAFSACTKKDEAAPTEPAAVTAPAGEQVPVAPAPGMDAAAPAPAPAEPPPGS